MKQKGWIGKYRIHFVICVVIASVAFGINQKIETDRNRQYIVSEPIHTLLKEITEAGAEDGVLRLSGWGFDTFFYNEKSRCELILQDVETGEALWPKMEKDPNPVQIAKRYTDGEDYSDAGFKGSIKSDKLAEGSVYEVLLRYTSDYVDEAGNEQKYVRTVTMDKFIYQNQMSDYNPKTFIVPEIAGTELEKELDGAKLFHYFPEGMWIYYDEEKLYYIMENTLAEGKEESFCPLHWYVRNNANLPEEALQHGYGNNGFQMESGNAAYADIEKYKVAILDMPSEHMTYMDTGFYYSDAWVLEKKKQLEY